LKVGGMGPTDITKALKVGRASVYRVLEERADRREVQMRYRLSALMLVTVPLVSGIAHAECLPTLGTEDCFRAGDPWVQAIEHHYLDFRARERPPSRAKRHAQSKKQKVSPASAS
jgi:hypothetical protein